MAQFVGVTDVSTPDSFGFVFHCERCGAGIASEIYAFNTEGIDTTKDGNVRALLWARQHKSAYARALDDAKYEFSACPVCGRRVCCNCFHAGAEAGESHCADCEPGEGTKGEERDER